MLGHVESAARGALVGALVNSGQDCTAATRIYAEARIYDAQGLIGRSIQSLALRAR